MKTSDLMTWTELAGFGKYYNSSCGNYQICPSYSLTGSGAVVGYNLYERFGEDWNVKRIGKETYSSFEMAAAMAEYMRDNELTTLR